MEVARAISWRQRKGTLALTREIAAEVGRFLIHARSCDDPDLFIQSNDGGANVTLNGGRTWSTQHNQPTAELYQVDLDDRFPYWLYAGQQDNSTIRVPSNAPPGGSAGGHTGNWHLLQFKHNPP